MLEVKNIYKNDNNNNYITEDKDNTDYICNKENYEEIDIDNDELEHVWEIRNNARGRRKKERVPWVKRSLALCKSRLTLCKKVKQSSALVKDMMIMQVKYQ